MEGTSGSSPGDVTRLLLTLEAQTGDPRVVEQLVTILYDHLRSRARGVLHGQAGPMQPTELVHEAFLTLVEQTRVSWRNRAHFLAVAARVMRRILVDHHRATAAAKRGGGWLRVNYEDDSGSAAAPHTGISACMLLMFPTIYGIALADVGDDAKLGSAGLIFAIGGGCPMPPLQGAIMDLDTAAPGISSTRLSFVLPLLCFVVIAWYGWANRRPPAPAA